MDGLFHGKSEIPLIWYATGPRSIPMDPLVELLAQVGLCAARRDPAKSTGPGLPRGGIRQESYIFFIRPFGAVLAAARHTNSKQSMSIHVCLCYPS